MVRTGWFEENGSNRINNNSLRNSDQMIYFERMALKSIQNSDKDIISKNNFVTLNSLRGLSVKMVEHQKN